MRGVPDKPTTPERKVGILGTYTGPVRLTMPTSDDPNELCDVIVDFKEPIDVEDYLRARVRAGVTKVEFFKRTSTFHLGYNWTETKDE